MYMYMYMYVYVYICIFILWSSTCNQRPTPRHPENSQDLAGALPQDMGLIWAVPVVRRASKECLGPVKLTSEPVLVSDFPKFRRQAQNQRGKERQRPVRVTHIVVSVSDLESLAVQVNFLLPDSGPDGQGCTRLPAATATRPSRLAGPEPRRGCGTVSTPSTGTAQEAPPLLQEGQGAATCASLSSN